jgi:hypothetical protein
VLESRAASGGNGVASARPIRIILAKVIREWFDNQLLYELNCFSSMNYQCFVAFILDVMMTHPQNPNYKPIS